MIFLFTDFGFADIYVGQVKAALLRNAPGVPVVDLLHDAPAFNVKAAAHLLAALSLQLPEGSVTMAVVDPGVGSERSAAVLSADGKWWIGPDNGLMSVLKARAQRCMCWHITWQPQRLSRSFHGRDIFAPIAADIALGGVPDDKVESIDNLDVRIDGSDLAEIIYIDHYGNAATGLRAASLSEDNRIAVAGTTVGYAPTFSAVPAGALFWYANSLGLTEIAANSSSAADKLRLSIGLPVSIVV